MYTVHPDNDGLWILYKDYELVIAWFTEREDAEFALKAFENRETTIQIQRFA